MQNKSLYLLNHTIRSKRISSYSRSGGNDDYIRIEAGAKSDIALIEGAGIIRHIWITISCKDSMILRNAILRMFWDGEKTPSVETPIGDFFGQGWGESYNLITPYIAAAPSRGKALNCYFPMPFADGARLEIENLSDMPIDSFYYYVDYEEHASIDPAAGRFHACWNRECTTPHPEGGETEWEIVGPYGHNTDDAHNYLLADLTGSGHLVGIQYYVDNPSPIWYGEGDDMWMIDGEKWPGSMHGTGTEDFFNSAWCPNEVYNHPYFGYGRVPSTLGWMGRTHCYRFLIEDPIYFSKSLRGSIEHGHDNCLTLDICSVAYWYQAEPHKPFAPLPGKEGLQNMPAIGVGDVHYWRHIYRQQHDTKKPVWGSEWRAKR